MCCRNFRDISSLFVYIKNVNSFEKFPMLYNRVFRYHGNICYVTFVAVEVLGVSTRVGHRSCTHAFLHVGTHKVITWALCSLYKE